MNKYNWEDLNKLQVGKYAEYFMKMEFTLYGYDVYTTEVDDKGIDFVVRDNKNKNIDTKYYDVQVKSVRSKSNYIFFPKKTFILKPNLLAAIIHFIQDEPPKLYLIPSTEWNNPNKLLVGYDYKGKKSNAEWGISITKKNIPLLDKYQFDEVINKLDSYA